ncbi:hypothetical protein HDU92_005281 [Lobulomyces angularis]|nr:hypothetical protein HDU92_005281 [Lobulomyces angularis]
MTCRVEDYGMRHLLINLGFDEVNYNNDIGLMSQVYFKHVPKQPVVVFITGARSGLGQWSNTVIRETNLTYGSVLTGVQLADEMNYSILVLRNQNLTALYDKFLSTIQEKLIFIAHSYGGEVLSNLVYERPTIYSNIKLIALTDSVHTRNFKFKSTYHWIVSDHPLNNPINEENDEFQGEHDCNQVINCYSAGTEYHHYTTNNCSGKTLNLPSSIQEFNCDETQITKIDNLQSTLKYFNCCRNQITKIENLPKKTLKKLWSGRNQITKIENLPSSLEKFYCSKNQITKIENLPSSLQDFYSKEDQITRIENQPLGLQFLL